MEYAAALLVLVCIVALVVVRPLIAGDPDEGVADARREELEAAKEAKYREIRDAELDLQMGKLSREDHRAIDRELRDQAIEILGAIDELEGRKPRG